LKSLSEEKDALSEAGQQLRDQLLAAEQTLAAKEGEVVELQASLQSSKHSANEAKIAKAAMKEDFAAQLSALTEEKESLSEVAAGLREEVSGLKASLEASEERAEARGNDHEALLKSLSEEKDALSEAGQQLRDQLLAAEQTLAAKEGEVVELQSLREDVEQRMQLVREENEGLRLSLTQEKENSAALENQWKKRFVDLEDAVAQGRAHVCLLEDSMKQAEKDRIDIQAEVNSLKNKNEVLSLEKSQSGAQKYELIQSEAKLKKQIQDLLQGMGGSKEKVQVLEEQLLSSQENVRETQRAKEVLKVDLENKLSALRKDKEHLVSVEMELRNELSSLRLSVKNSDEIEKDLKSQIREKEQSISTLHLDLESKTNALVLHEEKVKHLQIELDEHRCQQEKTSATMKEEVAAELDRIRNLHAVELQDKNAEFASKCEELVELNALLEKTRNEYEVNALALSASQSTLATLQQEFLIFKESTSTEVLKLKQELSERDAERESLKESMTAASDKEQQAEIKFLEAEALQAKAAEETRECKQKVVEAEKVVAEYSEKEIFFIQYKAKAFSTIEGLQNEIDMLQRKLHLTPEQQANIGTIDLVKTTKDNTTPHLGDVNLAGQNSSHDVQSLENVS
jgi:chromosome segregation ATPase